MGAFITEDFLLDNKIGQKLYHDYAEKMPIFDYHCHLSPEEIAENKRYKNITEVWLRGDHYKWRAMRSNGIAESYITGEKRDKQKFMKWAATVPYTLGNPLYHWTHLELKRYFEIEETLRPETAEMIWDKCNKMLTKEGFTARKLLSRLNVKVVCTTDSPVDSLDYHQQIKEDESISITVTPTFRPDGAINIEKDQFSSWLKKLGKVVGKEINTYEQLLVVLEERINYFHQLGCRVSDHDLSFHFFKQTTKQEVKQIFNKKLTEKKLTKEEVTKYKTHLLIFLGREYAQHNWAMQLHIGGLRNNNTQKLKKIGPNTGFDSIADFNYANELSNLLDTLDKTNQLPKTILYGLNPADNYILGTMIGNFQGEEIAGKLQFGPAWWFNDHKFGIEKQLIDLANLSLLPRFVGMVTDSRSFLSYVRHEYFRRILCNIIGNWVEQGEYPADFTTLEEIVQGICYNNAKQYFKIDV